MTLHKLAHLIHRRTDGNPLFMVNVADYLAARGVLVQRDGHWTVSGEVAMTEAGVPASLQQLIEQQLERLGAKDQRVLEVASVAGAEFSAATVAAGLATEVEEVEERCTELVRRELFLQASGTDEWPDGTVATRYGFRHALYQEVLYGRIPASRRQRLHQRIGEREEQAYGKQAREIAAELAVHFERGRDYRKAVQYLQHAGENAMQRSANQEAITLLTKGLELLKTLPDTPERAQQELTLQVALGGPLTATKGYAAPEVKQTYLRAHELCQQVGETPQLFPALWGLYVFHITSRGQPQTARELGERLLHLAQRQQDPSLLFQAHYALASPLFGLGEFALAQDHLEQVTALYNRHRHRSLTALYGYDPGVGALVVSTAALWNLGYPDQAIKRIHAALTLAQELAHPHSLATALYWAAWLYQCRREGHAVQERAEALIVLSREQGLPYRLAWGTILQGWALAEQGQREEGITQIRQGLAAWRTIGVEMYQPYFLALLAEAYEHGGQTEEGLNALVEALAIVNKTAERWYEAELYRLYGELTLQKEARGWRLETGSSSTQASSFKSQVSREVKDEAEGCFLKAIEIARRQQAKMWELRATVRLARLWQQQGKKKQAHKMLAEIYNWFTEGFDTKDLQEAKTLLEELTSRRE